MNDKRSYLMKQYFVDNSGKGLVKDRNALEIYAKAYIVVTVKYSNIRLLQNTLRYFQFKITYSSNL
jgi:hypothetical protein